METLHLFSDFDVCFAGGFTARGHLYHRTAGSLFFAEVPSITCYSYEPEGHFKVGGATQLESRSGSHPLRTGLLNCGSIYLPWYSARGLGVVRKFGVRSTVAHYLSTNVSTVLGI